MRDGVILRADHYAPALAAGAHGAGAHAVRTGARRPPARRAGLRERGFHVVSSPAGAPVDSGGAVRADAARARRRARHGRLAAADSPGTTAGCAPTARATSGSSSGRSRPTPAPELKAMATIVTAATSRDADLRRRGVLARHRPQLGGPGRRQGGPRLSFAVELRRGQPKLQPGLAHLPLAEADTVATGAEIEFFQRWLAERGRRRLLGPAGPRPTRSRRSPRRSSWSAAGTTSSCPGSWTTTRALRRGRRDAPAGHRPVDARQPRRPVRRARCARASRGSEATPAAPPSELSTSAAPTSGVTFAHVAATAPDPRGTCGVRRRR